MHADIFRLKLREIDAGNNAAMGNEQQAITQKRIQDRVTLVYSAFDDLLNRKAGSFQAIELLHLDDDRRLLGTDHQPAGEKVIHRLPGLHHAAEGHDGQDDACQDRQEYDGKHNPRPRRSPARRWGRIGAMLQPVGVAGMVAQHISHECTLPITPQPI